MPATFKTEQKGSRLCSPSFAPVRSILPKIGITARRAKQINSVLMIRDQREQRKQEVAFNARPFVLCGIPLRPVRKDHLLHRRRNGNFFLHIVGHPDFGLHHAAVISRGRNRSCQLTRSSRFLRLACLEELGPQEGEGLDSSLRARRAERATGLPGSHGRPFPST